MPYAHKKVGKNDVVVTKKDSGETVGHTTPGKLNSYLAALHIHSGDKAALGGYVGDSEGAANHYAKGGVVPRPMTSPIREKKEDEGFNHGPDVAKFLTDKLGMGKPGMMTVGEPQQTNQGFNIPQERNAKVIGNMPNMAKGGIVSPYPGNSQMVEESHPGEAYDEGEDREFKKAAFGTIAGSNFDVEGGDTTTAGVPPQTDFERPEDASYTPPALNLNDMPMNQPTPDQKAMPPTPPPQNVPQGIPQALPGMPPDVNPDEIEKYIQGQKQQINKYGPEQQLALQRQLTAQRTGLPHALISGAKGFSDALMQGVARAGSSGNQEAYENQTNELAKEQMGAMGRAGEQNMQQIGANRQVDMIDPKSTISKAYQASFAPVFQQMGIPSSQVAKMSGSQIETVAEISAKTLDYRMQQEMKKAMLDVQRMTAMGTIQNQQAERAMGEQKLKAEHPIMNVLGMIPKVGQAAATGVAGGGAPAIKPGTVYKGHVFLGGNPGDKNSWRKQ